MATPDNLAKHLCFRRAAVRACVRCGTDQREQLQAGNRVIGHLAPVREAALHEAVHNTVEQRLSHKNQKPHNAKPCRGFSIVVGATGLEPATSCSESRSRAQNVRSSFRSRSIH
jgi:hypothetical protein